MVTQKELKRLFIYNEKIGSLVRRIGVGNQKIGSIAGSVKKTNNGKKYRYIVIKKRYYLAHRLIWVMVNGRFPENEIDHINGNSIDNRIENLRDVSTSVNHKNYRLAKNNTSGYVGVTWFKSTKKWKAAIKVNKKDIHLGYFLAKDSAIKARKDAERKYGFHKNHGASG